MGSSYEGAHSDCYHCTGCGTYRPCDDCTSSGCQKNMNEHRRLRTLEDNFIKKVDLQKEGIYPKCISAINYLKEYLDLDIIIPNDNNKSNLEKSKDIIEEMKIKKEYIKEKSSSIKEDSSKKEEMEKIKNEHEKKMNEIKNEFNSKKKEIEDSKKSIIQAQRKKINKKENEKKGLETKKDKEENKYNNIFETFKAEQEKKLNEEFEIKKKDIYSKYADLDYNDEPVFDYTEKEKNEKNYLLENIRQIQKISQIIPNYQSFIQNSGLIKYLL